MQEQIDRDDAEQPHREKAQAKLRLCEEQYADLSHSLELLLDDLFAGRARLKVYHQMKMYKTKSFKILSYLQYLHVMHCILYYSIKHIYGFSND